MTKPKAKPALWREELCICPLMATNALGAIHELGAVLAQDPGVANGPELIAALEAREAETPTFLGRGLALPHARTTLVGHITAAVGFSPQGAVWGTNAERAHLVLALAVPTREVRGYLELVSRLTKAARLPEWETRLASCANPGDLVRMLHDLVGE